MASHVAEVLANIERQQLNPEVRAKLRLVALVHDTFKNEVDRGQPRSGDNHHGMIARRFLERFSTDTDTLEITELHGEAYNAWRLGNRRGDWLKAERRAARLIARLDERLHLYLAFYRADNAAGDKQSEPLTWFEQLAGPPYPCPCCGYLTSSQPGSFDICPICGWEDDLSQLRFAGSDGGANDPSLLEAQANFERLGVADPNAQGQHRYGVRAPNSSDRRDPGWRAVRPEEVDVPEEGVDQGANYPPRGSQLYYWRNSYWRRQPGQDQPRSDT